MSSRIQQQRIGAGLVGALIFVEIVSGVLQGYYTPLAQDIARHLGINDADVNWFEAGQLLLSALAVPVLAKLGDLFGHQRVLFWSAVGTAVATWGIALAQDFWVYLIFWALQGLYVVWLPLDVALIYLRSRGMADRPGATRRATGLIVAALQAGAILGALSAGLFAGLLPDLWLVLTVPAILTTGVAVVIAVAISPEHDRQAGSIDMPGFALIGLSLILVTGGLGLIRVLGTGSIWPWVFCLAGLAVLIPFGRHELRAPDPLIDLRVLRQPNMWPVQLTALLFGFSVLGAQMPLSTFAQTDPDVYGYGLGLNSSTVAPVIGGYVLSLLVGALIFSKVSEVLTPRTCLLAACCAVALGYGSLLLFHDSLAELLICVLVAGLGSGALVAGLPAAAAAAAPEKRVAVSTGMTNTTKTIGGAFASAIFGIALAAGVTSGTAASLSGYYIVWAVCAGTAAIAAVGLVFVPKLAFASTTTPIE